MIRLLMLVLRSLASFSCVMHIGLLQTERKKFLLCYSYISKREFDWISIQPIEVPDRQIHVFPTKLLGEGGEQGSRLKGKFPGGGGTFVNSVGGGMLVWKKVSRFEISRSCHLCGGTTEKSIYLRSPPTGISAFSFQLLQISPKCMRKTCCYIKLSLLLGDVYSGFNLMS